jgi:beta-1,2-mannobiose phosphorylase / 1,2-beta-oligomannan phosphorylase
MEPEPGNRNEIEGVLNPAAARGPDGQLYLFPRLVARSNFSRIGIARVNFNGDGNPIGIERLGIALEPQADYELRSDGGGCEDPRITFFEDLQRYIMTYTAFGSNGPRIALAASTDLHKWERLGLATFLPCDGLECQAKDFARIDNKDAVIFPKAIRGPNGENALAMIHRPLFPGTDAPATAHDSKPRQIDVSRESMWISYAPLDRTKGNQRMLCDFRSHHRLACPEAPWEELKIGAGTPPVLTQHGWVLFYHGVAKSEEGQRDPVRLRYSAGVLLLSKSHPRSILYRSLSPVLEPQLAEEQAGTVANVVFPTAIDQRTDLDEPNRVDIYYGLADSRIGVARAYVPENLPLAVETSNS